MVSTVLDTFEYKDFNILGCLLRDLLIARRDFERLKCRMVEDCLDFNLYDTFEALDRKPRKGYVTTLDLLESLEDTRLLGMPIFTRSASYVQVFLSRYDKKLKFCDFIQLMSPSEDRYLRSLLSKRPASGFALAGTTFLLYQQLWQKILDLCKLESFIEFAVKTAVFNRTEIEVASLREAIKEGDLG
jgi:hypothetical protein